jgi:hypothetical protein
MCFYLTRFAPSLVVPTFVVLFATQEMADQAWRKKGFLKKTFKWKNVELNYRKSPKLEWKDA